jgi:hypothetical protein
MSNSFNLDLFRRTYQGPTVRVKLVAAENAASYLPAIPFTSSKDVTDYFSTLEEEPREVVIAAYLDNKHRFLAIEEVSRGLEPSFEPRAILQGSMTNAAASSGAQSPSGVDRARICPVTNSETVNRLMPIRCLTTSSLAEKLFHRTTRNSCKQTAENGKITEIRTIARKIFLGRWRHAGALKR